jgi:hypothetical protein
MKPRVGDWFAFRVADGRFAAARIGAVDRRGRICVGWFFGPFSSPPDASALLAFTREDAVWPARFSSLEGEDGPWERLVEGAPDAELWGVEHWSAGTERGPWVRETYDPSDPSKRVGGEHVDFETWRTLPSAGGVTSGIWLERCLPHAFDDPARFWRMALAQDAAGERYMRRRAPASDSVPAHTRFFLYFEDTTAADDAARRARELGLTADARPSETDGRTLVLAEGDVDTEFETLRERLEALADELGGEYDGHERAVP